VRRLEAGGPVVGLLEFAPFDQEQIQLDPGDTIIVFSDGVSEAMNAAGDEYGDAKLQELCVADAGAGPQAMIDKVIASVRLFTKGAAQSDDITVMVIRYLGTGA